MSPVQDRTLAAADGTRLHYSVYGAPESTAPAFLFIHGLGSNRTRWKRLAEEPFFEPYRRIVPDLRGHGDSIGRRGIDAAGMASDLEQILEIENAPKPVVVGHCMGANLAVKLWERNPGNIRALILIEPFITEELPKVWRVLHAILDPVLSFIGGLIRLLNFFGWQRTRFRRIDFSVYDDWVRPRLTHRLNVIRFMGPWTDLQCMPMTGYIASYRMLFDYRPPWTKINGPALVLVARHGGVKSQPSGGDPFDHPGIQVAGIEASHFVLTDNRAAVVQKIQSFMDELKRVERGKIN